MRCSVEEEGELTFGLRNEEPDVKEGEDEDAHEDEENEGSDICGNL